MNNMTFIGGCIYYDKRNGWMQMKFFRTDTGKVMTQTNQIQKEIEKWTNPH